MGSLKIKRFDWNKTGIFKENKGRLYGRLLEQLWHPSLTVIWKKSFRTKRINKDSVHYHKKAIGAATGDNSKWEKFQVQTSSCSFGCVSAKMIWVVEFYPLIDNITEISLQLNCRPSMNLNVGQRRNVSFKWKTQTNKFVFLPDSTKNKFVT